MQSEIVILLMCQNYRKLPKIICSHIVVWSRAMLAMRNVEVLTFFKHSNCITLHALILLSASNIWFISIMNISGIFLLKHTEKGKEIYVCKRMRCTTCIVYVLIKSNKISQRVSVTKLWIVNEQICDIFVKA